MPIIETKDGTTLYVKDWNTSGKRPVVLVHGWPLNADMWEWQAQALAERGHRVIAYDRRGFGRSSQPFDGYDYDTFAADLDTVLQKLDVKDAALVGFSMGGGEVARYLGTFGPKRVNRAVLMGAVTPFLLKTSDHDGAPAEVFAGMIKGIKADRASFFDAFGKGFYGVDKGRDVPQPVLSWTLQMAMMASSRGTTECVKAFGNTDFRKDMAAFTLPTLIQHGDADSIVPIDISARVTAKMIPGAKLEVYAGAPHGLFFTHAGDVNRDLFAFVAG